MLVYLIFSAVFVITLSALIKMQMNEKKQSLHLHNENEQLKNELHIKEIEQAVLNEKIKSFMQMEDQVALLNRELIDKHNENIELHIKLSLEEQKAFSLKRIEA